MDLENSSIWSFGLKTLMIQTHLPEQVGSLQGSSSSQFGGTTCCLYSSSSETAFSNSKPMAPLEDTFLALQQSTFSATSACRIGSGTAPGRCCSSFSSWFFLNLRPGHGLHLQLMASSD